MSVEVLDSIKKQTSILSMQEKFALVNYLLEQTKQGNEKDTNTKQLEWLKENRDKYAGQYIALDGDVLVANGATIQEVRQQAKEKGVNKPFVFKVFAEETIVSAGL